MLYCNTRHRRNLAVSRPVCITYDSTCDLTPALLERFQIRTVPLTIQSGQRTFPDDGSYTALDLYADYQKDGTLPKTAAVSPEEFKNFFAPSWTRALTSSISTSAPTSPAPVKTPSWPPRKWRQPTASMW